MSASLRAVLAVVVFVMGSLQAWDSDVGKLEGVAGFLVVLLVSVAIALPAVALLAPVRPMQSMEAFAFALVLLVIARWASPQPLPGLFLTLLPAGAVFIVTGLQTEDGVGGDGNPRSASEGTAASPPGAPLLR